jgi:hypothetical protein
VWTGGHLILSAVVLPEALRKRDTEALRQFEQAYERLGIPALLVQILTGLALSAQLHHWPFHTAPGFSLWAPAKWILLAITLALGLHARFGLFPKLNANNMRGLAIHIVAVTVLGVAFVAVGVMLHRGMNLF